MNDPMGRFLQKVDRKGPYPNPEKYPNLKDRCWIWTVNTTQFGYGTMEIRGKIQGSHRVSYELFNGPIPKNNHICHKCDNPSCVNPDHLFLGNADTNAKDRDMKKRLKTKLNLTLAEIIRIEYNKGDITQLEIAKKYNVDQSNISCIINNKIWRSL